MPLSEEYKITGRYKVAPSKKCHSCASAIWCMIMSAGAAAKEGEKAKNKKNATKALFINLLENIPVNICRISPVGFLKTAASYARCDRFQTR